MISRLLRTLKARRNPVYVPDSRKRRLSCGEALDLAAKDRQIQALHRIIRSSVDPVARVVKLLDARFPNPDDVEHERPRQLMDELHHWHVSAVREADRILHRSRQHG